MDFLIEDIKLYIREQSREFESGENGFYLERLNSGSEVRAMRNKSQNRMGSDGVCRWWRGSWEHSSEHSTSAVMSSCPQLKPEGVPLIIAEPSWPPSFFLGMTYIYPPLPWPGIIARFPWKPSLAS